MEIKQISFTQLRSRTTELLAALWQRREIFVLTYQRESTAGYIIPPIETEEDLEDLVATFRKLISEKTA